MATMGKENSKKSPTDEAEASQTKPAPVFKAANDEASSSALSKSSDLPNASLHQQIIMPTASAPNCSELLESNASTSINPNNTAPIPVPSAANATAINQLLQATQSQEQQQQNQQQQSLHQQPAALWQQAIQTLAVGGGFPLQAATQDMVKQQQHAFALAGQAFPPIFLQQLGLPSSVSSGMAAQVVAGAPAPVTGKRKFDDSSIFPNPSKGNNNKTARSAEPSVVSSSQSAAMMVDSEPPKEKSEEELKKMKPSDRRRYERNLREQQRSYRITQQIKQLRDVLTESNIPFKPNKYSILVSVCEYIKQLQARAIMLDAEHQKLQNTVNQASKDNTSSAQVPSSAEESDKDVATSVSGSAVENEEDKDVLLVQGIDYCSIFACCPVALGVATLDGRVLSCNSALERIFGCAKDEMQDQSLFLYIRNHQEVFEAMADILKRSSLASEAGEGTVKEQHLLYWCGHVVTQRCQKLRFNITLVSTADLNPKYFSFSASPPIDT